MLNNELISHMDDGISYSLVYISVQDKQVTQYKYMGL